MLNILKRLLAIIIILLDLDYCKVKRIRHEFNVDRKFKTDITNLGNVLNKLQLQRIALYVINDVSQTIIDKGYDESDEVVPLEVELRRYASLGGECELEVNIHIDPDAMSYYTEHISVGNGNGYTQLNLNVYGGY
jgi:hypothetical protein